MNDTGFSERNSKKAADLVKHYTNIWNLTKRQLEAIRQGNLDAVAEVLVQKQLIIDQIQKDQSDFDIASLLDAEIGKLRKLLTDISSLEEIGEKLLSENRDELRGQLAVFQKGKMLRQAYEKTLSPGHIVNRFK